MTPSVNGMSHTSTCGSENMSRGVQTFREDRENETELMTISYWESVEAMSECTGGGPRKSHHLERYKEFLIELPKEVQILRLLKSHDITGSTQDESS